MARIESLEKSVRELPAPTAPPYLPAAGSSELGPSSTACTGARAEVQRILQELNPPAPALLTSDQLQEALSRALILLQNQLAELAAGEGWTLL